MAIGCVPNQFQPTRTPLVTPLAATQPNVWPETTTPSSLSLAARPPSKEVNLSTTNQQQRQPSLASIQPSRNSVIYPKPTAPAASVAKYYQNINNRDLAKAWQQLPIDLQSNTTIHPQGYDSFVQWWDSVIAVDLNAMQTT